MEMVRLTTCTDAFEARVLAARLGAEGMVWSLRGGHDGPFAIGSVEVLVDAQDYASARELLESDADWASDSDVGREIGPAEAVPERETTGRDVLVLAAVLLGVVLFAVARMASRV